MWQSKDNTGKNKWVKVVLAFIFILVLASGCGEGKDTVATYEGGKVTLSELDAFLGADKFFNYSEQYAQMEAIPDFKEGMLKQYIAFVIHSNQADEGVKSESQKEAKSQMAGMKESFAAAAESKDQFSQTLEALKIKEGDLENYMELKLNFINTMDSKFSEEQVQAEYDKMIVENKNAFDIATVSHILIGLQDAEGKARTKEETLTRAQEVEQKLANGGDFATLVTEYSDDRASIPNQGKYENANVNGWVTGFKEAAIELPLNTISEPVESEFGYHIMKVEARSTQPYDEVKDMVRSQLIQQYFTVYMTDEIPKIIKKINLPTA